MTEPDIARLVALNLTAPILLTRAVLPDMLARGRGHLGFVGSIAGRLGVREEAVYSATKAGLSVFADSLRHETAGHGIVITELVPAVVDTAFFVTPGSPLRPPLPPPGARRAGLRRPAHRHVRRPGRGVPPALAPPPGSRPSHPPPRLPPPRQPLRLTRGPPSI